MKLRHLTILIGAAGMVASATTAKAEDSLLNKKSTRALTIKERTLFGPNSAQLNYDPRMIRAAQIATRRAQPQMTWHCWRYVKDALLAAELVSARPTSAWARDAGEELCRKFGWTKSAIKDPRQAPIGAVIVYGGTDAGHVELRTSNGFVSDFRSNTPYPRPLLGIFVKGA